ncbi:MAG: flavocytochrome c [Treponema sp.]|nr:flavocytochrome c [Treponema sp.]
MHLINKYFEIIKKIFKGLLLTICFSCCSKHPANLLSDGVFQGRGAGRNGPIVVEISVLDGKINSAKIVEQSETNDIGVPVEKEFIEYFLKNNGNTELDAVSGATLTSNGMISALQSAIEASHGIIEAGLKYADSHTDIVVIGAGGAGLTAATEAALNGAQVLVLEKAGIPGGNTTSATGGLNASETAVQRRLGIEDSNAQFYEDTIRGGHNKNSKELVKVLVEKSSGIVDWLMGDDIKADLSDVGLMGGSTNKRTHRPLGGQAIGTHLIPKLYDAAKNAGAEIRFNNSVTDIIEENGRAVGVRVKNEAGEYQIFCKAVIIATGGFGANAEMVEKYRPDLKGFATTNVPTTRGDAFFWVEKFDAKLNLMNEIQTHPTVVPGRGILITEAVRGNGAIMISHLGKRFVNELATRDVTSAAVLSLPEKRAYIFFNQAVRKSLKSIEDYDKKGLLVSGNSIEEIANKLGMEGSVLQATVNKYNQGFEKGKDEFGRSNLAVSLSKGPYYAVEIEPAIHHTMGGIAINERAQVIKNDGSIVPCLYAAGEVTGGVHGDNRLGGNSIADITIFGKIAADSALQDMND